MWSCPPVSGENSGISITNVTRNKSCGTNDTETNSPTEITTLQPLSTLHDVANVVPFRFLKTHQIKYLLTPTAEVKIDFIQVAQISKVCSHHGFCGEHECWYFG